MKRKILLYSDNPAVTEMVTSTTVAYFSDTVDLDVCRSWSCFAKVKEYDLVLCSGKDTEKLKGLINDNKSIDFCYLSDDIDSVLYFRDLTNCYLSGTDEASYYMFLSNHLKTLSIIGNLSDRNLNYSRELNDLKIIDRAKLLLIQYFGFSEKQAHHFIEKQSMNLHLSKKMIAEQILKTYDR